MCLILQALAHNIQWKNAMVLSMCFESTKMSTWNVWAFERNMGFTNMLLLGFSKQRIYICYNTFKFLRERLTPYLQRKNTHMREIILVKSMVAMSLQRLATIYMIVKIKNCQVTYCLSPKGWDQLTFSHCRWSTSPRELHTTIISLHHLQCIRIPLYQHLFFA